MHSSVGVEQCHIFAVVSTSVLAVTCTPVVKAASSGTDAVVLPALLVA